MNDNMLWNDCFSGAEFSKKLGELCCSDEKAAIARFQKVLAGFHEAFGTGATMLFSAPGRTEIAGNHTDHQHGCVVAASVNLDIIAAVRPNERGVIRVLSEGYDMDVVDLRELEVQPDEINKSASLVRGVAAKFTELGYKITGFDAYTISNVLKGSGISSSAAFEVLVGTIISNLFCASEVDSVEIAKIGQYAENVYFGKPCGLMDQMASSVGGAVFIDFEDTTKPLIQRIDFDFSKSGHALCIIDSGADHADLTDEYAAITRELKSVCAVFGKQVLREIPQELFMTRIPEARIAGGDRGVLRAIHVYEENKRVHRVCDALEQGDFERFLSLIRESGRSSFMYLQNVLPTGATKHQAVALTLALCDNILCGRGAFRIHGGGFAGTVQAFVPLDIVDEFKRRIESVLGEGHCFVLSVRPVGGTLVAKISDTEEYHV